MTTKTQEWLSNESIDKILILGIVILIYAIVVGAFPTTEYSNPSDCSLNRTYYAVSSIEAKHLYETMPNCYEWGWIYENGAGLYVKCCNDDKTYNYKK